MLVYARRYVVWLWLDEELDEVTIETMRLLGEHEVRVPISKLVAVGHEASVLITGRHRIRTPYLKLRVRGRRLPYVIDLQGHISDETMFWPLVERVSPSGRTEATSS